MDYLPRSHIPYVRVYSTTCSQMEGMHKKEILSMPYGHFKV